jgi:hypothetical protein
VPDVKACSDAAIAFAGVRLDFRQTKVGEGPVIRRAEDEWIEANTRHEALIPEDWFTQAAAELERRGRSEGTTAKPPTPRIPAAGHRSLRNRT